MSLAAFKPQTMTQQVGKLIRDRILTGELAAGDRIVEQTLAKELGVGQNVVRESLIELAHRGFVRRHTNKGTYVTKLSIEEAIKIAEVRGALEGLAVEHVFDRWQRREISLGPLRDKLTLMRKAAVAGDREEFYDHDIAFHQLLWKLSDNEFLGRMLDQVVIPLFTAFIVLYMRRGGAAGTMTEAVDAHDRVIDEIEHGTREAARKAICELVDLSVKHQRGLISGHD